MERWENVYSGLLDRLQDICRQNGISMWLADRTALSALRHGTLTGPAVTVFIHAYDALRLEEAVRAESDDTLGIESVLSNAGYPGRDLRVYDPRTTDCDTSDFFRYDNNCMHVTVKLLAAPAQKKSLMDRLIRKVSSNASDPADEFRKWCRSQSRDSVTLQAGKVTFKGDLFNESRAVTLYERTFNIPADTDAFFTSMFGPGWEYSELTGFRSDGKHFYDPDCSWKDRSAEISREEIREYGKTFREYRAGNAEYRSAQKELTRVQNITDRSYDRIQMYKLLKGREAELKELAVQKKYDELESELMPFLTRLKKYCDLGLDLYIDDEITELTEELLKYKGMNAFAQKIRELLPGSREEIVLTDHLGNPLKELPQPAADEMSGDGPSDDGLSETQKRLLEMMKRVDAFMKDNGIEYFLFGGSLLGAVRHDGFIPWDDDMDIVVSRENYYKLVEASERIPWDDIAFDCCEKNPDFHKPFAMFTLLTDTRFVNDRVYFGGAGLGTGIDVFVMDNVPRDELDEYLKNSLLYQEIQTDETIKCADIRKYEKEYFECKEHEAAAGKAAEVALLKERLEKYGPKKEDDLQIVRLWARKPRIYEPGMMEHPVMHKFEDAEFPVPEKAVECLEMQYGEDWNVIPPDAGRKIHAFKIDFDLAAVNYYRQIDSCVDWKKVSEALDVRKKSRVRLLDKRLELDGFRKKLAAGR